MEEQTLDIPTEISIKFSELSELYDSFKTMRTKYIEQYKYNDVSIEELNHDNMLQILTKEKLTKELLIYEFLNINPKEKHTIVNDLVMASINALNRYQYVVGGYNIEDILWHKYTHDSETSRFKIKENQIVLANTISESYAYDNELRWFMKNMILHIKKYNDNPLIKISYKIIEDHTYEIYWILIIFTQ